MATSEALRTLPLRVQSLLGLHQDVNDALPLGGHCCPVLGQGHHGTCIQQPVAIRMAHCGGREGSIGMQESRHPTSEPEIPGHHALTFPAHTIGGPIISIEVAWLRGLYHQVLHVPPGEVLTGKVWKSLGVRLFGTWLEKTALQSTARDRLSLAYLLGLQGESNDASCQRGRSRGSCV